MQSQKSAHAHYTTDGVSYMLITNCIFSNMHADPERLAPSSWSAVVGVDRSDNSLGLHHCGGGSGKSHSHERTQPRKPQGYKGGRMIFACNF